MRTVFMGTPGFSVPVLVALLDAGREVAGVYTQPDRPVGRRGRPAPSPIKEAAEERGLPVFQPPSLKQAAAQDELARLAPDVIVVAAYGLFLPKATLDLPPLGCVNLHPSLLPRYRGPSPVASAILSGDAYTGVTVIRLDEGMDTGPIITQRQTAIGPDEDGVGLTERLFRMGAELLVETLPEWEAGGISAVPQDNAAATTTRLLKREDGEIDWGWDAAQIARQLRAYQPWPGVFTRWRGKLLKIIEAAEAADHMSQAPPGQAIKLPNGGLGVATANGTLEVMRLQLEG
ncbi:MAG: methionyl-tRNA formyltransferase, partial [Planctomycetota bacterium]|nr:methionyl-tRNA formyltransferase [Planctomycetota bacterium]